MKALNAIHFRRGLDFFMEFIPQIILLLVLFGWMDFLIIQKWLTDWTGREASAPSIISTMIAMFLRFGEVPENVEPLVGTRADQQYYSNLLLLAAVVCMPWMLLPKPLILKSRMDKEAAQGGHVKHVDEPDDEERHGLLNASAEQEMMSDKEI